MSPTAGTTGPSLEAGRRAIEKMMDDVCTIKLDEEGPADNTFDEDTLLEVPPDPDELYVYQGRCMVRAAGGYSQTDLAGRTVPARDYRLKLPVDSPDIPVGAVVRITASRRDPLLVDQRFTVTDRKTQTFTIAREIALDRLPD